MIWVSWPVVVTVIVISKLEFGTAPGHYWPGYNWSVVEIYDKTTRATVKGKQ